MRHGVGGARAWHGSYTLYKYTETAVKNIDNENPRNRNGKAAKPHPHCMKIHIRARFCRRRSAKRAFLQCGEARYALPKSTLHATKEPLSQCGKASITAPPPPPRPPAQYYAQRLKTRVFAAETLSVNSIGTLAEVSTYALHKYTVPDEYPCITRLTLYLLIVIPLEYESYVVSLHKISCTREIKSKLSFLSFALPLYTARCGSAVSSQIKHRIQVLL